MDPLLITTQVDLSGANALSAGVVGAMAKVLAAQQAVNEQAKAMKETYAALGAAAASGNSQAAAAIANEMGRLAEAKILLDQAKESYRELGSAAGGAAEEISFFAASQELANSATTRGISDRQAATASLRLLEGGLQGSTRAAGALLTGFLGLGPIVQAAFPVIGAIALIEVLARIPEMLASVKDWWAGVTEETKKAFDEQEKYYTGQLDFLTELQAKKEHLPEAELAGSSRTKQEIADYQKEIATIDQVISALSNASAARADLANSDRFEALGKQGILDQLTQMQSTLKAQGVDTYQIPLPKINVDESDKEFKKQTEKYLDELRQFQLKLERQAETIRSVKLPELQGALPAEQFADQDAIARANTEAHKRQVDADAALDEENAKHQLAIGQITSEEEVRLAQNAAHAKLQAEVDALSERTAALKQDPRLGSDSGKQAQIITNESEIAALREKMRAQEIAGNDAVAKAALQSKLNAINEEIDKVKGVPAASVQAEKEALAQIDQLRRQALEAVTASGAGPDSAAYKSALKEFENANRELEEGIKKADDEATEHRLSNLRKVIELQDQAAQKEATKAVGAAGTDTLFAQDALARQKAGQIKPQGGIQGGLFDLAQVRSDAAQQESIVDQEIQKEKTAFQTLAQARVAGAQQGIAATNAAELSGSITAKQASDAITKYSDDITKSVQDNADKQAEIDKKKIDQEEKIEQQAALKEIQLQQQISSGMAKEIDKMLFSSKNLHDAITKLWQDMARSIIEQIVKMGTQWVTTHLIMIAIEKLFHQESASGGQNGKAMAANAQLATSDAGAAAGAAFSSTMENTPFPANLAAAPAAGAAALSQGLVYAGFASAEGGWDLPSGGPFPMVGHGEEMMLPAELAGGVRDMVDERRYGNTSSETTNEAPVIGALHYHAGPIHALDSTGVDNVVGRHQDKFARTVTQAVKQGRIDPRKMAARAR